MSSTTTEKPAVRKCALCGCHHRDEADLCPECLRWQGILDQVRARGADVAGKQR